MTRYTCPFCKQKMKHSIGNSVLDTKGIEVVNGDTFKCDCSIIASIFGRMSHYNSWKYDNNTWFFLVKSNNMDKVDWIEPERTPRGRHLTTEKVQFT